MFKKTMVCVLACAALSTQVFAAESCQERPLLSDMHKIKTAMQDMSSHIRSGDNEKAEKDVQTLVELFTSARSETPYMFVKKGLNGDELAQETEKYHTVVDNTIAVLNSLDAALKAGETDKVKGLMGKIGEDRKIGHSSFKADC